MSDCKHNTKVKANVEGVIRDQCYDCREILPTYTELQVRVNQLEKAC